MKKNSWGFGVVPFVWVGEAPFHRSNGTPDVPGMRP